MIISQQITSFLEIRALYFYYETVKQFLRRFFKDWPTRMLNLLLEAMFNFPTKSPNFDSDQELSDLHPCQLKYGIYNVAF